MRIEKRRAPSFPKAPSIFDGGKPNSVPSPSFVDESLSRFVSATKLELGDDHLSSSPSFESDASKIDIFIRETGAGRVPQARDRVRRYPRIDGPAVLPLFCLAPHGVFPASRITPRAVSSYLAISPLPAPRRGKLTASLHCQRTGGIFSVTLSVTATPRLRDCGARVFYAACCRMVFGLSSSESRQRGIHQRSSAIDVQSSISWNPGNQELIHSFRRFLKILILRCRKHLRSSINKIEKEATRSSRECLRFLALLRLGAGLFGDVAGAVERALHPIVF
jgi:hypothetical protein